MKRVMVLFCFMVIQPCAFSANYYVNNNTTSGDIYCTVIGNDANNGTSSSSPKATISSVLNSHILNAGDVIYIDAGSYSETNINIGTNDDGSASGFVTFQGAGSSLTIFNTTTSHTFEFITNGLQYIKIKDLQIANNTSTSNAVYLSANSISSLQFENCLFSQSGNNEVIFGQNNNVTASADITFLNCTITNSNTGSDADLIEFIGNWDNLFVSNCTLNLSAYSKAIYISTSSSTELSDQIQIDNNIINSSYVGSSDAYGIYISGYSTSSRMTNVSIYGNLIVFADLNDGMGIYLNDVGNSGSGVSVYQNKIRNGEYGIQLYADITDAKIYNNYVSNSIDALYVNSGSSVLNMNLYFNSFYAVNRGAYISDLTTSSDIRNNIFYSTSSSSSNAALDVGSSATLAANLNYNLYFAPNGADVAEFGSSSYTSMSTWKAVDKVSGATLGEENGQNGDPKFVNAATNDLSISNTSSLAINKAVAIGGIYTVDINNSTRSSSTPWIGAFENQTILPVELLAFTASCSSHDILISWVTATEHNTSHFRVDKSRDGENWQVMNTMGAAGNTNYAMEYMVTDYDPAEGMNYYRLAQFDLDGVVDMFGPIAMDCYSDQQLLSIFPNPVIDKLNVTLQSYTAASGQVKAEVKDVQGKNYYTGYIPLDGNAVQHSIDCSSLDPGTYLLVVYAEDGTKETRNFIVK